MAQWFYQRNGQQFGPVETTALTRLARDGELDPADLIWRDGFPQWVPASKARGLFPEPAVALAGDADPASFAWRDEEEPAAAAAAGQRYVCTGCGGLFPLDSVYDDHGRIICKRCHAQQAQQQPAMPAYGARTVGYAPVAPTSGTGMIVAGYACAAVALVFCPPGFGIAAIVIGVKNCHSGRVGHGTAQIIIAAVTTVVGMIFGAYVMSHR